MNEAENILTLNELWERTSGEIIAENVKMLLFANGYKKSYEVWENLVKITGSNKHAVYAWLNRARTDVKIPFLKLCKIAEVYNIEIIKLLTGGNFMFEKKFAVTRTIGNNEEILKTFGENEKEAAIAYGAEVAKTNENGVIACIFASFDENGNMYNRECRIFEVWQ